MMRVAGLGGVEDGIAGLPNLIYNYLYLPLFNNEQSLIYQTTGLLGKTETDMPGVDIDPSAHRKF